VDSSRRIPLPRSIISNGIFHWNKSVLWGLFATRIDAARATESMPWRAGSILYIYGGSRLWNPMEIHRVVWKNFPIQLLPECLSASSATAVAAVLEGPLPPQSIRIDLWALNGRSGCLYRSIRIPLVGEVSFKIKDTFQWFATPHRSRITWSLLFCM